MTHTKKFSIRSVPYRVWLVLLLILWIGLLAAYHNTRAIRRERLRMDVSWDTCEVELYETTEGRDRCRYMRLVELQGFEMHSDDWTSFSDGMETFVPDDVTGRYADLLLMDKITAAENGYVLFRNETSGGGSTVRNFTLAVWDTGKNELYYIEYNS